LTFVVQPPAGNPQRGGPFALPAQLQAGMFRRSLTLPTDPLPGSYVETVKGGGVGDLVRVIELPSPPQGVFASARIAATRNGPSVKAVHGSASRLWAYFDYAAAPTAATRLEITWHPPGRHSVSVARHAAPEIETFVTTPGARLTRGTRECTLSANGKAFATVDVRVV
jgi:hypothetical protein